MLRFEEALDAWTERRLTQEEAAQLLEVCPRTFRRYVDRYEAVGDRRPVDKRLSEVSARRAPVDVVLRLEAPAAALKPVYTAPTEAAASVLDAFEAGPRGHKHPGIGRGWSRLVPFFAFSAPIRRAIQTTNVIESPNRRCARPLPERPGGNKANLPGIVPGGAEVAGPPYTGTPLAPSSRSTSASVSRWWRRDRRLRFRSRQGGGRRRRQATPWTPSVGSEVPIPMGHNFRGRLTESGSPNGGPNT